MLIFKCYFYIIDAIVGAYFTYKTVMKKIDNKIVGRIVLIVLFILVLLLLGVYIFLGFGKRKLMNNSTTTIPDMEGEELEEALREQGYIYYNGKMYKYNSDITNILLIGIDSPDPVPDEDAEYAMGFQNDGNYVLILDGNSKKVKVLAIDRNTMTEIYMYNSDFPDQSQYVERQICLQHGFGGGRDLSCELTVESVSKLLYNLPISGYLSVNYGIIEYVNDCVGGVTVTVTDDVAGVRDDWIAGEEVTLVSDAAIEYVRYRDKTEFGSANVRLNRQKGYVLALYNAMIERSKSDITFLPDLYKRISNYTVTDISVDEMTYLLSQCMGSSFTEDDVYFVPGETVQGIEFEEFYVDEDKLNDLMIELFYIEEDEGDRSKDSNE